MVKIELEKFEAVKPAGLNNYYARVLPKKVGDMTECVEDMVYGHKPTQEDFDKIVARWTEKRRTEVCRRISVYAEDKETVKLFKINGTPDWFESETRTSLRDKVASERRIGRTSTVIYSHGVGYEMTLDQADSFLDSLQVYAADCYHVTEQHINNVNELEDVEDIESYDYKTNYPEILEFEF